MSKRKIYIAGKVTGEEELACWAKFKTAEYQIRSLDFEPINPMEVIGDWEMPWDEAMPLCLAALESCDGILMLEDHTTSPGAKLEMKKAIELGFPVFHNYKDISYE